MKTAFRLSVLVIIAVYSVAGCGEDPPEPANFVSASPTAGSTIEPDAAISVLFDDVPRNVVVNPGRATTAGQTVTISGPFTAGPAEHHNHLERGCLCPELYGHGTRERCTRERCDCAGRHGVNSRRRV